MVTSAEEVSAGIVLQDRDGLLDRTSRHVEFVTHNYRVVERPDTTTVPVTLHRPNGCYRGRGYVG